VGGSDCDPIGVGATRFGRPVASVGEVMAKALWRHSVLSEVPTTVAPDAEQARHHERDRYMALPTLTPEQRAQALEKAAASRRARAALREELKTGKATFAEVLGRAGTDEIVGRAKVLFILESLPKIGKATALEIVTDLGISETRRMGGLGSNQRAELLERLG